MFDRCDHERGASFEGGLALVVDGDHYGVAGGRLATVPLPSTPSVFLGRLDGAPLFLTEAAVRAETMLPFREAALALAPDDVALLAYAHGMSNWMRRTRYCSACGGTLQVLRNGHVRFCGACRSEVYPRTDPAVMMLVTHEGRLLLAQHKGRPTKAWSTLAGFVEPGESLEAAARRELQEETGLAAKEMRYFGSQSWPLPASLMIGFVIEVEEGALHLDANEIEDARWFTRQELEGLTLSSSISLSRWMIESWREQP